MFQLCIIFVRYNLGVYEKIRVDLGKASKLTVSINFFQLPTVLLHRKCIQKKLKHDILQKSFNTLVLSSYQKQHMESFIL